MALQGPCRQALDVRRYSIIRADIEKNRDDILPLLERNLRDISAKRYDWLYSASPHGNACCWLAMDRDSERFVGSASLFPRRLYVGGAAVRAAIAGDFAVDREHRAYGPALRLQRTIREALGECGLDVIYGVPNRLSERIFLRIGYSGLGRFGRFVKVLKAEYKRGQYIPPAPLTRVFSSVIDLWFKGFSREAGYRRPEGLSVEEPASFDERFDRLWERALPQFAIIGVRDSRALNWRFKGSPHHDYRVHAVVDGDGGGVGGYIVYFLENNACYIADVLFIDSERIRDALFAEFVIKMRERGVGLLSVRCLGGGLLEKQLRRFGFFPVKEEDSNVVLCADPKSTHAPMLLKRENWYFLDGDTDY